MSYAKINAITYYLPGNAVTNDELALEFSSSDIKKTEKKIGIKQRHIAGENETAADLAYMAALDLLSNFNKEDIDYLLFCTQSPDYFLPTSACLLQHKLGLRKNIGAFDFNLGCSGFVYGLSVVKGLIQSKQAKNILLLLGETYSKHLHPKDKANRMIFGDAGVACLVSATDSNIGDIGEFIFGTDGSGFEQLIVKNGGFRHKTCDALEYGYGTDNLTSDNNLYMNGPEIFNFTIENIPNVVNDVLVANKTSIDQVDAFVFHQANKYMLSYLRDKIGIPEEKFIISMENSANTVSCTIPIAIKNELNSGKLQLGNTICIVGFGVGLSWGATIIKL